MPADLSTPSAKNLAIALLAATQFVVVLDASIVIVALLSMASSVEIPPNRLSSAVNAYPNWAWDSRSRR